MIGQRQRTYQETLTFRAHGEWSTVHLERLLARSAEVYALVGYRMGILPGYVREMWMPEMVSTAQKKKLEARYAGKMLMIRSIVMHSPGPISLAGSGEIVREIRELIKDLWWRNRTEKERAEWELRRDMSAADQLTERVKQDSELREAIMIWLVGLFERSSYEAKESADLEDLGRRLGLDADAVLRFIQTLGDMENRGLLAGVVDHLADDPDEE